MKKKSAIVNTFLIICSLAIVAGAFYWYKLLGDSTVEIPEENPPLAAGDVLLSEGERDYMIIPDRYNTGCDESSITTFVTGEGTYNDIPIVGYGTSGLAIYMKEAFPDTIVFENYDFSYDNFILTKEGTLQAATTIIFRNCKFSSLRITDIGETNVDHIFEDCTFIHFAGSNATFERCYFGDGAMGDGINPYRNCTFNDCMIANLVQRAETGEGNHVDGFQVFGDSSSYRLDNINIHLNNCRFEVPNIPYTFAAGILNCPITFTMRYSNASDISFSDCIVNGGTYYSIMLHSGDYSFTNVTFENIWVGGSRKSANVIGDEPMEAVLTNVCDTPYLYIGSVWKDTQGIHLSVTNDTNIERVLKIVTSNGTYEQIIPACPISLYVEKDSMDYEDFPFDIDICVEDAEWVACFDVTGGSNEQIRFVNFGSAPVYVDAQVVSKQEFEPSDTVDEIVSESVGSFGSSIGFDSTTTVEAGICGDNVTYRLDGAGCLYLSGEGGTYSYNSSKPAPWYEECGIITSIIIDEGITQLGTRLFAECDNVTEVVIPDGVTDIGGNAFIKAGALAKITLPDSVTNISKYAFAGTVIEEVVYGGSKEQWEQIYVGEKNDVLYTATIEYNALNEITREVLESGVCGDDVQWEFYSDGLLRLFGTGSTYGYNSSNIAPWGEFRADILKVVVEDGITTIGSQAFTLCINLEEAECADSVQSIESNAFIKCKALKSIGLGNSLGYIGRYAFASTGLETVHYNGTQENWHTIEIADKNESLVNADICIYE